MNLLKYDGNSHIYLHKSLDLITAKIFFSSINLFNYFFNLFYCSEALNMRNW